MAKEPDQAIALDDKRAQTSTERLRRRRRAFIALLLLTVSFAVLLGDFAFDAYPPRFDEPYLAWAVKRVAEGYLPYREVQVLEPPLVLYGPALYAKAFGASIGDLRMLMIGWLCVMTLLLYWLLLGQGLSDWWAACTSIVWVALLTPFWPIFSHHWFAAGFGMATLHCAFQFSRKPSRRLGFLTGMMASYTGLSLQSDGIIIVAVLILLLILDPFSRRSLAPTLWLLIGIMLPLFAFMLILSSQDLLGDAYYLMVVSPTLYYKKSGGFNDVNLAAMVHGILEGIWGETGWKRIRDLWGFSGAAVFPLLFPSIAVLSPSLFRPTRQRMRRWGVAAAGASITVWVYGMGRTDLARLLLFGYVFLALAAFSLDWKAERFRPVLFKAWVTIMLVFCLITTAGSWIHRPPLVRNVMAVDAYRQTVGPVAMLTYIPEAVKARLPVVDLPHGEALYFYYAPVVPPVGWISPPEDNMTNAQEYAELVQFIQDLQVPYILLERDDLTGRDYAREFLTQPSVLRTLLRRRYHPFRTTPWGVIFQRNPDPPPRPAAQGGGRPKSD